jgi:hypothetical protein
MRVRCPARVLLAEAMVFVAITFAAASVVLPVTDTIAAMCGATGGTTMDQWFRRFELESLKSGRAARRYLLSGQLTAVERFGATAIDYRAVTSLLR